MTKVVYKFPITVRMPIGAILPSGGFEEILNQSGIGAEISDGMSYTVTFENKDGKGLTAKQNQVIVNMIQTELCDKIPKELQKYKDWRFTAEKGIRQDESE